MITYNRYLEEIFFLNPTIQIPPLPTPYPCVPFSPTLSSSGAQLDVRFRQRPYLFHIRLQRSQNIAHLQPPAQFLVLAEIPEAVDLRLGAAAAARRPGTVMSSFVLVLQVGVDAGRNREVAPAGRAALSKPGSFLDAESHIHGLGHVGVLLDLAGFGVRLTLLLFSAG